MALVTNTTANKPTSTSVLTLWNADIPRPGVSNLNPYAGQLVSNMTITDIGVDYGFKVHNASGSTNIVLDVAGTMENYPAVADPGAAAALRADGVAALRDRASQRATGEATASGAAPHGHPGQLRPPAALTAATDDDGPGHLPGAVVVRGSGERSPLAHPGALVVEVDEALLVGAGNRARGADEPAGRPRGRGLVVRVDPPQPRPLPRLVGTGPPDARGAARRGGGASG